MPVVCRKSDLESADFVDYPAVHGNGVCRAGEKVDFLFVHGPAGHIIGDNGNVKSHIMDNGSGKACALEKRSCFRADEFDFFAAGFTFLAHKAKNSFRKALGHNCSLFREFIHKIFCDFFDFSVTVIGHSNNAVENRLYGVFLAACKGSFCRFKAGIGYHLHAFCGGWTGVGNHVCGKAKMFHHFLMGFILCFICGKDHTHARCKIGTCALGDHFFYCRCNLRGRIAGYKAHRMRITASVKNTDASVFVPRYVFIS